MTDIAVIIILYNPSKEDIENAKSIAALWDGVIVDNSPAPIDACSTIGKMKYICNHSNLGIAEAQNIGIRELLSEKRFSYIVFLDQDSRLSTSYPYMIVEEFKKNKDSDKPLAILGPTVINLITGKEYKSAIHHYVTDTCGFSQRQQIISSGSCISVEALRQVGFMDSHLFIDYVDYDWCWRANAKGYQCGITTQLSIEHHVGSREITLGKYKVIISAPIRYYYQYRNYLWLVKRKYVPLKWKMAYGCKLTARFIYFPLIVKGGSECWKHMRKGICDGLTCRA